MKMIGEYRIALLPSTDEAAFVKHMTDVVFKDVHALQLTRVTEGFAHELLKCQGDLRQYAWRATVLLMGQANKYDFAQNEHVQESIKNFGVLIGVQVYIPIEESLG